MAERSWRGRGRARRGPGSGSGRRRAYGLGAVVAVLAVGAVGAIASGLIDLGPRSTFVPCGAFAGEVEVCDAGVTIESLSLHRIPQAGSDRSEPAAGAVDLCEERIDWVAGERTFEVRDGCAGLFRVTYRSEEEPRPDPATGSVPIPVDCGPPLSTGVVRCDTGGHRVVVVGDDDGACAGNLRYRPGWRRVETRGACRPTVAAVPEPGVRRFDCNSPGQGYRVCRAGVAAADDLSVVETNDRCSGGQGNDRLFRITDLAVAEVHAFGGCVIRFEVRYRGDLGPPEVTSPFGSAPFACEAAAGTTGRCPVPNELPPELVVDVVLDEAPGPNGCDRSRWRWDGEAVEVDGCAARFVAFHEPPPTRTKQIRCASEQTGSDPATYVVCRPNVTEVVSISLVETSSTPSCRLPGRPERWRAVGETVHVYGGCDGVFDVVHTGRALDSPTADVTHPAIEVPCSSRAGSTTCETNVDGEVVTALFAGPDPEGAAPPCETGAWRTIGRSIEVDGCGGRFHLYYEGRLVNPETGPAGTLRMPFDRFERWTTFIFPGHSDQEYDLEPVDQRSPARTLAVADGTARYVCGVAGRHARVELETADGTFVYLHLDDPDVRRRFGPPGSARPVAQGDVLGELSPVIGIGPAFIVQDGGCFATSGSVHLHLETPTNSTWIDGYHFTPGTCEILNTGGRCPLPESTNRAIDPQADRPPEPRDVGAFEGTVVRLLGNELERSTYWVEGGRLLLIASIEDFEDCLAAAVRQPVRIPNDLPAGNGWSVDETPGVDRCPGSP